MQRERELVLQITNDEFGSVLRISGSLDINAASQLRKALWDSLAAHSSLALDLSEVDACDVAGFQVIYSAQKTASGCNKTIRISGLSVAMATAGDALGLALNELTEQCSSWIPEHWSGIPAREENASDGI